MSSDISKMFQEVALLSEDHDVHRFHYRDDPGDIVDCRMKRLTFGITASLYLASQVLRQLALDHREDFPRTANLIYKAFYMDDCLTGANSVQEACSLCQELNQLLDKAQMTLRKLRTNSSELLATIPEELRETSNLDIALSPTEHGKALGLRWDTSSNVLYVCTFEFSSDLLATTRSVSSIIAKTFDLMGWYALAVLPPILILQELWTLHLSWDKTLPETLQQHWKWWLSELPPINRHPVSRHIGKSLRQVLHQSIHGFCDASSKAYGGVMYLRTVFEDTTV